MISKQYKTEFKKEIFLSKLDKYQPMNLSSMGIRSKTIGDKGFLFCGFRATKKFSINFLDEKHISVASHIGIIDIIFFCISLLALVGMIFVFVSGEIKEGVLCAVGALMLCVISALTQILPWRKVNKVLSKEFGCTRKK